VVRVSDPFLLDILVALRMLVAPITIAIALTAFASYLRFRNWRLLFLAAAFLLLSVSPVIQLVLFPGLVPGLSAWTAAELAYASYIFSIASVLPFALLAYVYFNERKTRSIEITPALWTVGGLLMAAGLVLLVYQIVAIYWQLNGVAVTVAPGPLVPIGFISGGVSYLLIILIVISLFSYHRARRTGNTLLVMVGFICLLISWLIDVLAFMWLSPSMYNYYLGQVMAATIALAGYITFLAALLRLKVWS
jgi:hypothetical protein